LGVLYSLFKSVEESGVEQRSTLLQLRKDVNADAAQRLELDATAPLLFIERVRFAGDLPLAIDRAWLPLELTKPLLDSDFERTALYDEMERHCGFRPDSGWERFTPVVPHPADRALLDMRSDEAAFFLERRSESLGKTVEWRTTTIRGDRYHFVSKFELGVAPPLVAAKVQDPESAEQ
jgi:GntR family transcriptional regulator